MRRAGKSDGSMSLTNSQNFITDTRLLRRIVNMSSITKEDTVWEIGTGKGHLTQALCRKCGFLYSAEIDRKLLEKAKERLASQTNLKLIHGDFLKQSLPAKGAYKVFANIPYFITTQILDKLTGAPNPPTDMWLIMEKGAAKRFLGIPNETNKSLLLKVNWDMKILYRFERHDFHPMPGVDSVLLRLTRKPVPDLEKKELASFEKFIERSRRCGFAGGAGLLTKKQASAALKLANLPPVPPGGETLYIQWLCLFRCYQKFHKT
ncbi:MAG: 23S ribosomal RNA methyltransferase Erm [Butyrivibrio sp.]|nr:23S ribosomal RNA methyltransferase Erm [Butyrivibrio sp.]